MTGPASGPPRPGVAGVYDCLLGGTDHSAAGLQAAMARARGAIAGATTTLESMTIWRTRF